MKKDALRGICRRRQRVRPKQSETAHGLCKLRPATDPSMAARRSACYYQQGFRIIAGGFPTKFSPTGEFSMETRQHHGYSYHEGFARAVLPAVAEDSVLDNEVAERLTPRPRRRLRAIAG